MKIEVELDIETLETSQAALEIVSEKLDKDDWYHRKLINNAINDIKSKISG